METAKKIISEGGGLSGARADFVASLGRRVADARTALVSLEGDPNAKGARDDLRRKLHALGAGAKLLKFEAMAGELATAETTLEAVVAAGRAAPAHLASLAQLIDDLPALAWSDPKRGVHKLGVQAPLLRTAIPMTALVVASEDVAAVLSANLDFDCERLDLLEDATDRARSLGPDVIVLDGDLEGAANVVEALLDDPITESIPIVVLGHFSAADHGSRFIALGVQKTLTKPIDPDLLRKTCRDVADQVAGNTIQVSLGEPTVEQLGDRLAEEVRHALVDAVDATGRNVRVQLGEGAEVYGALWGAIARIREVVQTRTDGAVKFAGRGPENAIAFAPWLHGDNAGAERAIVRGRGAAADVRLDGRRVIVADDDPGVTWFIADLLRTSGCTVYEALDGTTALDLAYKRSPDLIVSDILMPGMDGFALSRTLRRDVALRDTPVILLSWKEDLLQRVRELGASAAAYLRKESDARAIVARVREALWPRARIEARLRSGGDVRGRLDGITVRTLLEIACALRPESIISIRDASHNYEIEVRGGSPKHASRTAVDGRFERGERVIAALLGVTAARFSIAGATRTIEANLHGTLADQLAQPIAIARAAASVLGGTRTIGVNRVDLDGSALAGYLLATPQNERELIERIALGDSPRELLLGGEAEPSQLEEVLVQLAARGVVRGVRGISGEDLLTPAIAAMCAAVGISAPPPIPERVKTSDFAERNDASVSPPPSHDMRHETSFSEPPPVHSASVSGPAPASGTTSAYPSSPPSSLADAVMRELRERSSNPPPIVEPSSLRLRAPTPSQPTAIEQSPRSRTDIDDVYEIESAASATPPPQLEKIHEKVTAKPGRVTAKEIEPIDFDVEFAEDDEIPVIQASEPRTPAPTANSIPPLPKNKGGWLPLAGLILLSLSAAAVLRWTIDNNESSSPGSSVNASNGGADENVAAAAQPAAVQAAPTAVEKGDAGPKP
ncbi:MAG: response regulator [Polyangiaceae bacterium]